MVQLGLKGSMYISRFFKDSYILLTTNIVYIFCYLFLTSAIIKIYGLESFSIINYILIIHGFVMILFMGISASVTGHIVSKTKERKKFPIDYTKSIELAYLFCAFVLLLIFIGIYFFIINTSFFKKIENLNLLDFRFFWTAVIFLVLSRFLVSFYDSVLVAKKKFNLIGYIKIFLALNYFCISIIIFFYKVEFKTFLLIFIISNLFNKLIYYILFKRITAIHDDNKKNKFNNIIKDIILTIPKYLTYSGIGLITVCSVSLMNFYAIKVLSVKDFSIYGLFAMIIGMTAHLVYPLNRVLFSYSINYNQEKDNDRNFIKAIFIFLVNIILPINFFFIFKDTILELWLGVENFYLIDKLIFFIIIIFVLKSLSEVTSSICVSKNKAENLIRPRICLIFFLFLFFLISNNLNLKNFITINFYFYLIMFLISYMVLKKTKLNKLINKIFYFIILLIFSIFLSEKFNFLNYYIIFNIVKINIYFLSIFLINLIIFSFLFIKI